MCGLRVGVFKRFANIYSVLEDLFCLSFFLFLYVILEGLSEFDVETRSLSGAPAVVTLPEHTKISLDYYK